MVHEGVELRTMQPCVSQRNPHQRSVLSYCVEGRGTVLPTRSTHLTAQTDKLIRPQAIDYHIQLASSLSYAYTCNISAAGALCHHLGWRAVGSIVTDVTPVSPVFKASPSAG
jgi:hypothetical protein